MNKETLLISIDPFVELCFTEKNAFQVMGYADTDVAQFIYTNKPLIDELPKFLCKDLSKAPLQRMLLEDSHNPIHTCSY
jgi:hypothetical protein